jgi:hypothetical protein
MLSLLQNVEKMKLPLRHQDTKVHKDFIINDLVLVNLSAFESWWQKKILFGVVSNVEMLKSEKAFVPQYRYTAAPEYCNTALL